MQNLRSHNCSELNIKSIQQRVTLMGWVHSKRDLGGLIFIDIRDNFGITQVVIHPNTPFFNEASQVRQESVIQVKGIVNKREGAVNNKIPTGEI